MTAVGARGLAIALASVALALPAGAQVRSSERGTVSQVVDGTTITIDYSRPVARGRDSLFGKVVHWGRPWTPGANSATTLETDHDIRLDGHPLPKGKYSVWMIARPAGDWTVLLHRDPTLFHVPAPDSASMLLGFAVTPEQRPAGEEVLTWSFPSVAPDAAMLRMQWGTTAVAIRVTTPATRHAAALPAEERAKYVGTYALRTPDGPGPKVRIADEGGTLRGRHDRKLYGLYDYYELVPDGPQRFKRALYANGELAEVESEFTLVFDVASGRATGFRVVNLNGQVVDRADRVEP